jgi:hypothetical protein
LSWQEGAQDLGVGEGCAINFAASLTGDSGTFYNVAQIASFKENTSDAAGTGRLSALTFSTSGDGIAAPTERMRLDSSGTLKVGNSVINETPRTTGFFLVGTSAGSNTGTVGIECYAFTTATRHHISFGNTNGVVGSISTNASATAYNTSSDYRLKQDVEPMAGALDRLMALNPVRFRWMADPDGDMVDGFIAHEAQAVVPEAVTGTKDEVDEQGRPAYQGIDQSKLVPLLAAALQETFTEIQALKAEIAALKAV